jgi:hypothetical protein
VFRSDRGASSPAFSGSVVASGAARAGGVPVKAE